MFENLKKLLAEGVAEKCFPGAVLAWGNLNEKPNLIYSGNLGFSRNKNILVNENTIYDIASLSKVFCTTILLMLAYNEKLFQPQDYIFDKLNFKLPENNTKHFFKIEDLLSHQTGLRAWHPFYKLDKNISYQEKKIKIINAILSFKPEAKINEKTIYSDLNFILLGFLLEKIYKKRLNKIFNEKIIKPLKLLNITFAPKNGLVAPTEDGLRRAGPLNNKLAKIKGPVPLGVVHDDNAAYLGGISGHAGLFAAALPLWKINQEFFKALVGNSDLIKQKTVNLFIKENIILNKGLRPWGFDFKKNNEFLNNTTFSSQALVHTGYTGATWLWDYKRNFAVILLTNRVQPFARNNKILAFRKKTFSTIFKRILIIYFARNNKILNFRKKLFQVFLKEY